MNVLPHPWGATEISGSLGQSSAYEASFGGKEGALPPGMK
jgi:hypothetical protein